MGFLVTPTQTNDTGLMSTTANGNNMTQVNTTTTQGNMTMTTTPETPEATPKPIWPFVVGGIGALLLL
jgi:hypothetical protein